MLSEPCLQYCESLRDPWSVPGAYIPTFPSIPSACMQLRIRGIGATSATTGLGYICFDPQVAIANDRTCGTVTSSAYAGTGATLFVGASGTGIGGITSQSPYVAADFQNLTPVNQTEYRIVSSGLAVEYTGTELNMGGLVNVGRHPRNASLITAGVYTGCSLEQFVGANWSSQARFEDQTCVVTWCPTSMGDFDYEDINSTIQPIMAAVITAPTATTSAPFRYDIVVNYEISSSGDIRNASVGGAASKGVLEATAHPTDEMGVHAVVSAHQALDLPNRNTTQLHTPKEMLATMKALQKEAEPISYAKYLGQYLPSARVVGEIAGSAARSYFSGGSSGSAHHVQPAHVLRQLLGAAGGHTGLRR